MVRLPPNLRERNQWVIKQALDTGVYGLVMPHLNTVEDAAADLELVQGSFRGVMVRSASGGHHERGC